MTIMEEREQDYNNYWIGEIALSEAFFSIIDINNSRSNITSGPPGNVLANNTSALAVSGKREQRVL